MNSTVLFREVQQFRQWWLWLVLAPGPLLIGYRAYHSLILGTHPQPGKLQLFFWLVAGAGLPILLYSLRLVTEVRSDGLYLRFIPFHLSFLGFPANGIRSFEARTYSPIREFGGWGIRYGWNGKAYNVSGNQGVQLELHDGKRILVGTQQPMEFVSAMKKLAILDRTKSQLPIADRQ
jgi:Family of unknown function (DUF6141)